MVSVMSTVTSISHKLTHGLKRLQLLLTVLDLRIKQRRRKTQESFPRVLKKKSLIVPR